ncbi:DUF3015 domain-containing protein [bacterium]|nr:DUF3015 domain-containing protein [bacterium]
MRSKICLVLCFSILFSVTALAKSGRSSASGERRYRLPNYGMGGCGLGTLIFNPRDNSVGSQLSIAAGTDMGVTLGSSAVVLASGGTVAIGGNPVTFFISGPTSAQSSSVVSGISNCRDDNDDYEDAMLKEQQIYVAVNLEILAKEAAQGSGNHLRAFADMLGCGDNDGYSEFTKLSQDLHAEIFSDRNSVEVTSRWLGQAQSRAELSNCLVR